MDIYDFENKVIITGLLAVKGLPGEMAAHIIEEREANGDFKSYEEFLERMTKYNIDAKSIKALVYSGTFDCFDKNVDRLMSYYEYSSLYYKRIKELKEMPQRSIFDIPAFSEKISYLQYIPDNNGYDLQKRLSELCAYNNVGIHDDVTKSVKNIKNDLTMESWQRDEDYDVKKGVLTGVLEEEFKISKKGKAYLSSLRTFTGDTIKLIVSKAKVGDLDCDLNDFKSGMVVDVFGSFKFPKAVETDGEEDDENAQGFVNNDIVSFPKNIAIKELDNPIVPLKIELDFDNMVVSKETVADYFGVDNYNEVAKKILGNFSTDDNGKILVLKLGGNIYPSNRKVNITLDDIKKLGCSYKVV